MEPLNAIISLTTLTQILLHDVLLHHYASLYYKGNKPNANCFISLICHGKQQLCHATVLQIAAHVN